MSVGVRFRQGPNNAFKPTAGVRLGSFDRCRPAVFLFRRKVAMKVSSDLDKQLMELPREIVLAQRAARASLRRGLAFVLLGLAVLLIISLFVLPALHVADDVILLSAFGAMIAAIFATRQMQWSVLATHQLRCPTCRHLLATDRRWWNSPGPRCSRCGSLAILPAAILDQASAT